MEGTPLPHKMMHCIANLMLEKDNRPLYQILAYLNIVYSFVASHQINNADNILTHICITFPLR